MNDIVFISLGSNIEVRENFLKKGLKLLSEHEQIELLDISSIYETEPVGCINQSPFLNMVISAKTNLPPLELLGVTQEIENIAQRKRDIRWGPRTLDLDILLYNHQNIKMDDLCIPHPRMSERAFVIVPLHEIHPRLIIPVLDKSLAEVYQELSDKEGVKLWKQQTGVGEYGLFGN